jgi:hypothetical protein
MKPVNDLKLGNSPEVETLHQKLEQEITILKDRIAELENELETIARTQFWRYAAGLRLIIGISSRIFIN